MADREYTEDDITDEEIEEVKATEGETDEESDEETHIETLVREAVTENEDRIADYVDDPETPEETARNESIKKFLVQKVRNKLLDSFEEQLKWIEDADLVAMMKKWKKMTAKDEDIDPATAMKRVIKENATIAEAAEQLLEDMMEEEDNNQA
jgi:hypothetical protein